MIFSLPTLKVAAKHRATRCQRLNKSTNPLQSPWTSFLLLLVSVLAFAFITDAKEVATNTFYVKINPDPNVPDLAHKIARRNGFHNLGPVSITWLHFQIKKDHQILSSLLRLRIILSYNQLKTHYLMNLYFNMDNWSQTLLKVIRPGICISFVWIM